MAKSLALIEAKGDAAQELVREGNRRAPDLGRHLGRRGRIDQRASSVSSRCERFLDQTPIFSTRLVEERGERITGGRATVGRRGVSKATRSCTIWRTRNGSAPSVRMSTTCDSPSTDLERTVFTPGRPLRARPLALTIPEVTVSSSPNGLPIATTSSGLMFARTSRFQNSSTRRLTSGMRVEPPTSSSC